MRRQQSEGKAPSVPPTTAFLPSPINLPSLKGAGEGEQNEKGHLPEEERVKSGERGVLFSLAPMPEPGDSRSN